MMPPFLPQCSRITRLVVTTGLSLLVPIAFSVPLPGSKIAVQLCADSNPEENAWPDQVLLEYSETGFAFGRIPQAYTEKGIRDEWPNPLRVIAKAELTLPEGRHKILLRSRRAARFWIDGRLLLENPFPARITDGHDPVERPFLRLGKGVRFPGPGDQEKLVEWETDGGSHLVRLEFYVGGFSGTNAMRPETGETLVAVSLEGEDGFQILSPSLSIPLTDDGWERFAGTQNENLQSFDRVRRRALRDSQKEYWEGRHAFAREWADGWNRSAENSIDGFISRRIAEVNEAIDPSEEAHHFNEKVRPVLEDRCWSCHGKKAKGELRLDSRGSALAGGGSGIPALVPGDPEESYLLELVLEDDEEDRMPSKGDPLAADQIEAITSWIEEGAVWPQTTVTKKIHTAGLTEDWQFLRRVYLDTVGVPPNKEELENFLKDSNPGKRKQVIGQLLDDPRWADHWVSYWQDVLAENPTVVNPTLNNTGPFRYWIYEALEDNLPMDRFVTELVLMEGSLLGGGPAGFEMASQNDVPMAAKAGILSTAFLAQEMKCSRCHDAPLHPELLEYLAGELVYSGYDLKSVARLILSSRAYQRKTSEDPATSQFFAARAPRQLSAEQIVDSLFASTGKKMQTEPLTVDIGGGRPWANAMSLGQPHRAWMFGGMANNRDRPSLVLPRAQAVIDVLTAFGWRASRQEPASYRNSPLSPLKPAILNNGIMASWLSQLSDDHGLTEVAIHAQSPGRLVETLYLRLLSRYPSSEERRIALKLLKPGFNTRIVPPSEITYPDPPSASRLFVTWANHLDPEADGVALAAAEAAKAGDPPTPRLRADWRKRMEDLIWSLINLPETIYYP